MYRPISFVLALVCVAAATAQTDHAVDTRASKVVWTGKKLTGQHQGTVQVSEGTITWGDAGLVGAEVVMDMTTIKVLGMDPEYGADLVAHLNSPDFFHTSVHKTASFKATKVVRGNGGSQGKANYTVSGDLTIKGITKPVTFNVLAWAEKNKVRAKGSLMFDRTLYDIKFRSGNFFQNLGDKMIEDMVELSFDISAREN